jgi:DNA-directed RNA polymerase specialized sigma24 family protein
MARSPEQIRHDLLVLRAQSGDREAVDELVRLWQTRLWRLAYAKVNDHEAAWDVVQDAWLAIIRGLPRLRQVEAFGAWAMQIVSKTAGDRWRRKRIHTSAMDRLAASAGRTTPPSPSIDGQMLSSLPEAQMQALVLYYWERMTVGEIAETLGVPAGTIKSRLYNARMALKQLLGEEE